MNQKRKQLARIVVLALGAAAAVSCGGKQGTLTVSIRVPAGDDPFITAASVHVVVGNPPVVDSTVAVNGGHFNADLQFKPMNTVGPVVVEALASDGTVLGRGRSPTINLLPLDAAITVFVGRVGKVGLSSAVLAKGRSDVAISATPRLGAVFVGGNVDGVAVGNTDVYDTFSHTVIVGAPLPSPRAGAVGIGFDRPSDNSGVSLLAGGAATGVAPSAELASFDPLLGEAGRWNVQATDASLARLRPAIVALPNGTYLISGGVDMTGLPLGTATTITVGAQIAITPVTATMAAARVGHLVVAGTFGGQDGALLFGGAGMGGVPCERFAIATASFTAVTLPSGFNSRVGASATQLGDGRTLIAGGREGGPALRSALLLTNATLAGEVRDTLLPTARTNHVAFLAGGELLFCGGRDPSGAPLNTCDVLDPTSFALLRTLTLASARADLIAVPLDTGNVLLGGGIDTSGMPSPAIELYTPVK